MKDKGLKIGMILLIAPVVIVLLVGILSPNTLKEKNKGTVINVPMFIREQPNWESKTIAQVNVGDVVEVLGTEGAWYYCHFGEYTGYLPAQNIVTSVKAETLLNNTTSSEISAMPLTAVTTPSTASLKVEQVESTTTVKVTTTVTTTPITTTTAKSSKVTTTSTTKVTENITNATTTAKPIVTTPITTTAVNTTKATTQTTPVTTAKPVVIENSALPNNIFSEISALESKYPKIKIGVGLYSLTDNRGMEYNVDKKIAGGCTVKAAYALFVLKTCEQQDISIYSTELEYKSKHKNTGSGELYKKAYGSKFTLYHLIEQLITVSDNTAYNILLDKFSMNSFQEFLNSIGGQQMGGYTYGYATVTQRKNEWKSIYQYVNSGAKYSGILKNFLLNAAYCYAVQGMSNWHSYMHKSGWNTAKNYTSASDCVIVDDNYLLIILTEDKETGIARTDAVRRLGKVTEDYSKTLPGGKIF